MTTRICEQEDCVRPYLARGSCRMHYARWQNTRPGFKCLEAALQRCYNPNNPDYRLYGGRGIRVCDRWRFGELGKSRYECFVGDMGIRPSLIHSIDRIDVDGNYEPGNCRWATPKEQSINTRRHKQKSC